MSSQDDDTNKTTDEDTPTKPDSNERPANNKALLISFLLMIVIGLGNKIFNVLQFIPMYNYPLFINLLTTFIYIPTSFAYIFPMIAYGTLITEESQRIPKYKFAVMGLLDSIAGIMQTLATNYIENGSLVILLTQAAIPISMFISYWLLKARYKISQFVGALVVCVGIIVVLLPSFINPDSTGNNAALWAFIMILSCIPMCLSSVYKEKALGEVEIDPVYLNGWVAIFQFLCSIPLLLPSAPASDVAIKDLPQNLWDGAKCYVGVNTVVGGDHADDCTYSPIYVTIYMVFNLGYNVLIILILKYGSANVLWLAMTIMVPLGNISFTLPFMPNNKPLQVTDIIGLLLILGGLITYRFWSKFYKMYVKKKVEAEERQALISTAPDTPATPGTPATPAGGLATPNIGMHVHTHRGSRAQQSSRARVAVITGERSSDDMTIQGGHGYQVADAEPYE